MLDPQNEQDSVNERYFELQLIDFLKRNGTEHMTSNLNMSNYLILNLRNPLLIKNNELRRFANVFSRFANV